MKYIILSLSISMMDHLVLGQTTGDFKSHQSGNWNVNDTWDQWDGSAWIHPAINLPNSTAGLIAIESGHVVTIAASVTLDQVIVRHGAGLIINPGRTLTIADDGTDAIDLLVAGEMTIDGILATSGGSTLSNSGALLATAGGSPSGTLTNLIIEGDLINDGIIDFGTGTIVFTGDSTTLSGTPASTSFFSMRVDSGAIVTSFLPLTLRNNLTVSESATLVASPGANATLFGNLSVTGTLVSQAMVAFPDTTTITGTGSKSFKDVLITGVLTPNSAYTITGDLSLSGKGTLQAGNSTTTFGGNTLFSNTGTGQAFFYNIMIPASVLQFTLTSNADMTVMGGTLRWNNGSFYSNSEITFGRTGTTRLTGTGSTHFYKMTVNQGTTFRPNIPCTITGNVVVNGTLIASNTVTFGDSTVVTTSGTPAISFTHVVIASGSSLTVPPGTVTINGNFTNNGAFHPNGGTIAFAGSAPKKVSGTSITPFHHISVINGTAGTDVSIESNSSLSGTLTLAANAHFDADGSQGTGVFTMLSSADNPTADASIAALPAGAIVQGNVTVQRYVSNEGPNNHRIYRYISSPVSNATVADLQNEIPVTGTFLGRSTCDGCGSQPSMFWYDEAGATGYTPFPTANNSEALLPGRGYAVFVRGNINPVMGAGSSKFDLRGPVNSGTLDYNVTFTPAGDGWNLVGNPYPSTIHWNAPSGWIKSNLGGSIYRLDNGENPSRYAAWNGTVGTNGGSPLIAAGQGFFVQTTGPSPSLISDENVKVPGTATTYFRLAAPTCLLRISLSQGLWRDETVLHFRDSASGEFDFKYDAIKLKNLLNGNSGTPFLNLSTMSSPDGQNLAINSLPPLAFSSGPGTEDGGCSAAVRLDVSDVPVGYYSLDFSNLESFPITTAIFLRDNFLNTKGEVDLRQQTVYSFQVTDDSLSFGPSRFQLAFSEPPAEITQIDPNTLQSNYETGNHWYRDGQLLEDTTSLLRIESSGLYTLKVGVKGCLTSDEKTVVITGLHGDSTAWRLYPNPVTTILDVEVDNVNGQLTEVTVFNARGEEMGQLDLTEVGERRRGRFDFNPYPSGVYFIRISSGVKCSLVKIIKK